MADVTDNLSAKQHKTIACLLCNPTIAEAAEAAGVGERTIYAWLNEPAFSQAYRVARRAVVSQATAQLQQHVTVAVKELGHLVSGFGGVKPEIRLAAAKFVLEMAIKSVELDDVQERLSRLEEAICKETLARAWMP